MPVQPFTQAGVTAKTTELYALSDSNLAEQANLIRTDFKNWMTSNFSLDTLQTASLNSLDPDFVDYISFQSSFAVKHRRPIQIDKNGTETSGKLIHTAGNITIDHSPSTYTVSGTLVIEITYS